MHSLKHSKENRWKICLHKKKRNRREKEIFEKKQIHKYEEEKERKNNLSSADVCRFSSFCRIIILFLSKNKLYFIQTQTHISHYRTYDVIGVR